MSEWYLTTALILLATVCLGLIRVLLGSSRVERLLALQLLGTTVVAVVLLLAHAFQQPGLYDLALVLGILAAIVTVAFVRADGFSADDAGRKP